MAGGISIMKVLQALVSGQRQAALKHRKFGYAVSTSRIEPFVKTPVWVRRAAGQEAERLAAFLSGVLTFRWKR
jgi:hypothetical protein